MRWRNHSFALHDNFLTEEMTMSHAKPELRNICHLNLQYSRSWIAEEDIYKPHVEEAPDMEEVPPCAVSSPTPEHEVPQSPPSVVHRRQIGILPSYVS